MKEAVREKEEEESKGERARAPVFVLLPPSLRRRYRACSLLLFPVRWSLPRAAGGRELGGRERFLSCLHFNEIERWEVVLSQRVLLETP